MCKRRRIARSDPERITFLKAFMAAAPPFEDMEPMGDDKGHYILAKQSSEYYLVNSTDPQGIALELPDDQLYEII